uniref:Uncharacterized protein n=1 Tax=Physcomitrium patens TaxID=3218 RepID=A0A2K1KJR7_PHYPA|nr:hypothetical protein PHYPA_007691 [Physcomitrium patens]
MCGVDGLLCVASSSCSICQMSVPPSLIFIFPGAVMAGERSDGATLPHSLNPSAHLSPFLFYYLLLVLFVDGLVCGRVPRESEVA